MISPTQLCLRYHSLPLSQWYDIHVPCTVETLYSTIYYNEYFTELNFDKFTQYVALWTHKKTPHTSPFPASYGVSFMSTSTEIDRVIKGFYCISPYPEWSLPLLSQEFIPLDDVITCITCTASSTDIISTTSIYFVFPWNDITGAREIWLEFYMLNFWTNFSDWSDILRTSSEITLR